MTTPPSADPNFAAPTPNPANFAAALFPDEWANFVAIHQAKKTIMPPRVFSILKRYVQEGGRLHGLTFDYIARYLETGEEHIRLDIACADFGYSVAELKNLREIGKTGRDVAAEVISRSVVAPSG